MSKQAGQLLWNHRHLTLASGVTDVDTGITQLGKSFNNDSSGEPPLGVNATTTPAPGTLPASRVQVLPMAPLSTWGSITHGEPYFNTTTNSVHVAFTNGGSSVAVNVWFFNPATDIGPGQADTYNP